MKGEERVCHVTEAGTPCGREPRACPKKCLHVRPPYAWAPALCFRRDKFREGLPPIPRFRGDRFAGSRVLPLCAAALTAFPGGSLLPPQSETPGSSAEKGIWWMPWH